MLKTCFFCGKEFEPNKFTHTRQNYCSIRCRSHVYYKKYYIHFSWRKEKECVVCGNKFLPKQSHQIQCSDNCAKKKWKLNHKEEVAIKSSVYNKKRWRKLHPETKVKLICRYCNKEFITDTGHKYQSFCSHKCKNKFNYQKSVETGKKKVNSKLYRERHLSEIKRKDEEYKAKIRFGVTSKTLNKRLVISRDGGLCKVCGKKGQVIHHIRYSGDPGDLVYLCRACHALVHQRHSSEPYEIASNTTSDEFHYSTSDAS